jgi:hypothetical protein
MECGKKGHQMRNRKIIDDGKYKGKTCPKKLNETKICYKECNGKLF